MASPAADPAICGTAVAAMLTSEMSVALQPRGTGTAMTAAVVPAVEPLASATVSSAGEGPGTKGVGLATLSGPTTDATAAAAAATRTNCPRSNVVPNETYGTWTHGVRGQHRLYTQDVTVLPSPTPLAPPLPLHPHGNETHAHSVCSCVQVGSSFQRGGH